MSVLSQIFGGMQTGNAAQVQQTQPVQGGAPENSGAEYLSKLSGGDTVEGKVVDIKGSNVTIELPGGGNVSAQLDSAMDLVPGQELFFEVRSNSQNRISLTPLYTNLTMAPTAAKALGAAGMAVNADTLAMTAAMMERGMPIDRESLGNMYQLVSSHPEMAPAAIVEMKSFDLPVDEAEYEQFEAFKNYESTIGNGLAEVAEGAIELFDDLYASGDTDKAFGFMAKLTEVINEEFPGETAADVSGTGASDQEGEQAGGKIVLKEGADAAQGKAALPETAEKAVVAAESGTAETAASSGLKEFSGDVVKLLEDALKGKLPENEEGEEPAKQAVKENVSRQAYSGEAASVGERLKEVLSELPGGRAAAEQLSDIIKDDRSTLKLGGEVLKLLSEGKAEFTDKELESKLKSIFSSEDFRTAVKNVMKDSWMLKPEQTGDKANVEQLYQKLDQQTRELTGILSRIAEPGSTMAQSLSNMSNNLDFMNQMNQMVPYIQLPLKMSGSEATGDLYVYTDKKSLASNDGNVSAMLHLDMENLGTVDVYAAISQGNKVSTKFYLESDEIIDLIAEHIHILNERLEKRGYSIKSEITTHTDTEEGGNKRSFKPPAAVKPVSRRSFDVRA